ELRRRRRPRTSISTAPRPSDRPWRSFARRPSATQLVRRTAASARSGRRHPRPPARLPRASMDSLWPMGGARDVRRPSLARLVPGIGWMRGYRLHWLPRDAFAAFGVGAMLVAQGRAFAYLLGLAPCVGLWTGVASILAYAPFGPSRQLMVGPEAGTAILALAAIGPAQNGESALAAFVALAIGVLLLLGGLLRLGAIADFLSAPLLVGYLNGMALVILASQLGE